MPAARIARADFLPPSLSTPAVVTEPPVESQPGNSTCVGQDGAGGSGTGTAWSPCRAFQLAGTWESGSVVRVTERPA